MKTKLLILLIGIFLIGGVIAGVTLSNLDITIDTKPEKVEGTITFEVDKTIYNCLMEEPIPENENVSAIDEGDIKSCAESLGIPPEKVLKNVKDWDDNYLQTDGSWKK